ncbi:hypothetical protein [Bosea sp. NBC_00550]|uniref:hypothetical protein n=1 Tax=Bosea sp. NBC_00550 TaxID=2969621 RepID=UPI002232C09C|nr:hypothetical protein [Bosea sp. NBC_00550]UZF91101.1 hypothetical protein NWE53_18425 [Bosea sp. NBC_00550]
MKLGHGILITRDGRELPLRYQFGNAYDDTRTGYLLCDTSGLDPAALMTCVRIICEDGTAIVAAVTHSSDRYLAVTGRVSEASI